MSKQTVHVNIDLPHLANVAHTGVRRAALFMGLGLNAAQRPDFRDYELHKLEHRTPGSLPPDILPRNASPELVKTYKTEFSTWITGCGLREILEHYGLMLDLMYHYCLVVAQSRHFVDLIGDPQKLLSEFNRLGIVNKQDKLKAAPFEIASGSAMKMAAFYKARNALTHGLGIVRSVDATDTDRLVLRWKAFEMGLKPVSGGPMVPIGEMFGVPLPDEMDAMLERKDRTVSFDVGHKVVLSGQDLYEICFFVSMQCIPDALSAFVSFLRNQGVESEQATT